MNALVTLRVSDEAMLDLLLARHRPLRGGRMLPIIKLKCGGCFLKHRALHLAAVAVGDEESIALIAILVHS